MIGRIGSKPVTGDPAGAAHNRNQNRTGTETRIFPKMARKIKTKRLIAKHFANKQQAVPYNFKLIPEKCFSKHIIFQILANS